jgi:hypothetical protein
MLSATLTRETSTLDPSSTLQNKIWEAKIAIDHELGSTKDMQYRRILVTTAYALMELEENFLKRNTAN